MKRGSTKVSRKIVVPTAMRADDAGINHRPDDHAAGFDLLREIAGDFVEHLAENPPDNSDAFTMLM